MNIIVSRINLAPMVLNLPAPAVALRSAAGRMGIDVVLLYSHVVHRSTAVPQSTASYQSTASHQSTAVQSVDRYTTEMHPCQFRDPLPRTSLRPGRLAVRRRDLEPTPSFPVPYLR